MRNALSAISDLLSIKRLRDDKNCLLHAILKKIGCNGDIEKAHHEWHVKYTRFVGMVQKGNRADELWHEMEASRLELRSIVEQKLHSKAGCKKK